MGTSVFSKKVAGTKLHFCERGRELLVSFKQRTFFHNRFVSEIF